MIFEELTNMHEQSNMMHIVLQRINLTLAEPADLHSGLPYKANSDQQMYVNRSGAVRRASKG